MVYRMYAPMAERAYSKTAALLHYYKNIYRAIGFVILGLGLCVVPFLDIIIKDKPDVPGLTLYYLIFLINTVISYWLSSYKASLFRQTKKITSKPMCRMLQPLDRLQYKSRFC